MNSADKLLKQAVNFQRLAQLSENYDENLRNKLINLAPAGAKFSFRQVAQVVLEDLTSMDREEKDPSITGASHALLNILNGVAVPDVNAMLNAATEAASVIQQKAGDDGKKVQVANYLVRLVNLLINGSNNNSQSTQSSDEGTATFLQRIYNDLKQNKPVNPADENKWKTNKDFYIKRLNGLNSLPNLTPQQEQEKQAIQFVSTKV